MAECGYCHEPTRRWPSALYCLTCERKRARSFNGRLLARAIKAGSIAPASELPCVDCGALAECYDHRDYSRPLDVEPVCRACNWRRGPGAFLHAGRQYQFRPG